MVVIGDPELPGRRFAFGERSLPIPAVQIFLMWFPHCVHVRIMRLATWLSISSLWICALCARGLKLSCAISKEDYPETSSNWVARGNAMTKIMSPEELEQELRAIGAERYHDKHPFHKLLHGGKLNKGQVQAWALNRYCYQSAVPRKDAALMSRCHDRQLRRDWIHRIMD